MSKTSRTQIYLYISMLLCIINIQCLIKVVVVVFMQYGQYPCSDNRIRISFGSILVSDFIDLINLRSRQ